MAIKKILHEVDGMNTELPEVGADRMREYIGKKMEMIKYKLHDIADNMVYYY